MAWKKACLIVPLLVALWMLKDDDDGHQLAVQTALQRHPPALRVFRGLFEISLLFFGAALSIYVWVGAVGTHVVGQLLFLTPTQHLSSENKPQGNYQRIATNEHEGDDSDDDEELHESELEQDKPILTEMEAMDAAYASDGEIARPIDEEEEVTEAAMPPAPVVLLRAGLDLLVWVLVCLLFFTLSSAEGGRYIEGLHDLTGIEVIANVAAPLFPLLLFVGAVITTFFPWQGRKPCWMVLMYTIGAPMYDVTFRDGFVGDVLTSSVRPLQDIAFTFFYLLSGLQGWWTHAYDLDGAALPVERSWIVHTLVLPACMVSPLWWRFNQNLRQVYDAKQRWPYLGNAFKYLAAAQVAMMGVFLPTQKTNPLWLTCAILATLYQLWWDIVMDWDLVRVVATKGNQWSVRLRPQRLYSNKNLYWGILIVNIILRFGWTMTFMPRIFLDAETGVLKQTFEGMLIYIDPVLASAEILRRTLWGFIRLELQAIQSFGDKDPTVKEQLHKCCNDTVAIDDIGNNESPGDVELPEIMANKSSTMKDAPALSIIPTRSASIGFGITNDLSQKSNVQILIELGLWTSVFAVGGMLAAAHRGTL
jgi:hypothetical protein